MPKKTTSRLINLLLTALFITSAYHSWAILHDNFKAVLWLLVGICFALLYIENSRFP